MVSRFMSSSALYHPGEATSTLKDLRRAVYRFEVQSFGVDACKIQRQQPWYVLTIRGI